MNFAPRELHSRALDETAARPLRLAALGDDVIGPLSFTRRGDNGLERSFFDARLTTWLGPRRPGAERPAQSVFAAGGETTVAIAAKTEAAHAAASRPDVVVICVGGEDCRAAIRGVAPRPDETVAALESIAASLTSRRATPVFVLPPPSPLFSNGLFADRYIAIAATLRRLCAPGAGPILIDSISALANPRAAGIVPDPGYATENRLNNRGAFRLARHVATRLRDAFPDRRPDRADEADIDEALNENPRLAGRGGTVEGAIVGACAALTRIRATGLGGARVEAATEEAPDRNGQRILFDGRYSTSWAFVSVGQTVSTGDLRSLDEGDVVEAFCDFDLGGAVENIASVSLHATPVWSRDFIGLHSSLYPGGPGLAEPHRGRLRTPRFRLPCKPKALHVSLQIHLVPGVDLRTKGEVTIGALALRKVGRDPQPEDSGQEVKPCR